MHIKVVTALTLTATLLSWSTAFAEDICPPGPKVKSIIINMLAVESEQVVETARFQEDLGTDELDAVELVMALEDEFKLTISDEDAETLVTVGDAIHYVEARVTCPAPASDPAQ